MSPIILVSLAIPAIAFAVIFWSERRRKQTHDGLHDPAGEHDAPPEFQVSERANDAPDKPAEEPRYREKAG